AACPPAKVEDGSSGRGRNGRSPAALSGTLLKQSCPAGPLSRQFRQLIPSDSVMQSGQFRVLHWNILAQALTGAEGGSHFDRVEPGVTSWERRRWYLLRELLRFQPGYPGLLSGEAALSLPLLSWKLWTGRHRILYNTHRFECLQSETGLLIEPNEDGTEFLDAPQRRRLSTTAAASCGLQPRISKAKVTFSNLRLLQTKALITALKERVPANSPLLLCGDFNGESFEPFYNVIVQSGLDIASAYKQPEEPPFTTFLNTGIDYIWYRRLRPLALLEIPPRDSVESNGLPCAAFPSDHFCLSVDFCFCKN
uniref:Nocturnin n=1 Tax=Macrostomum lignano TaxID=282301 RepID=A0A1I8FER9_9PLAT